MSYAYTFFYINTFMCPSLDKSLWNLLCNRSYIFRMSKTLKYTHTYILASWYSLNMTKMTQIYEYIIIAIPDKRISHTK